MIGVLVLKRSCALLLSAPGETVSIAEEMAARDALRRFWRFSHLPFDHKTKQSAGDMSFVNRKQRQNQRT